MSLTSFESDGAFAGDSVFRKIGGDLTISIMTGASSTPGSGFYADYPMPVLGLPKLASLRLTMLRLIIALSQLR